MLQTHNEIACRRKIRDDKSNSKASLSVHLNIAEGASRKSETERKRYYEVSGGSVIEIDAALDIANDLRYLTEIESENLGQSMINCFKILTGMIGPHKKDN